MCPEPQPGCGDSPWPTSVQDRESVANGLTSTNTLGRDGHDHLTRNQRVGGSISSRRSRTRSPADRPAASDLPPSTCLLKSRPADRVDEVGADPGDASGSHRSGRRLARMRMLHLGLRVTDLDRSLAFYTALGYAELGRVPDTPFGSLTMLQLPDDPFVSLELVHDPARPVTDTSAVNHLVVQTDDLDATIADLAARGVPAEPPAEPGPGLRTVLADRPGRLPDRARAVAGRTRRRHRRPPTWTAREPTRHRDHARQLRGKAPSPPAQPLAASTASITRRSSRTAQCSVN